MKKITRIAAAMGLFLALSAMLAGTAAAQDATLAADPPAVPAAATYDVELSGTGFPSAPIVLLCAVPESGDAADITAETCDVSNPFQFAVASGDLSDGAFTTTFSFDVPAEGLAMLATEAIQDGPVQAGTIITIDESVVLAQTGVESGLFAIMGLAAVAGGAMVVRSMRRD